MYSTCSLNALENEAVISEVFEILNKEEVVVELIDVHKKFKNFKMRKGIKKWDFCVY